MDYKEVIVEVPQESYDKFLEELFFYFEPLGIKEDFTDTKDNIDPYNLETYTKQNIDKLFQDKKHKRTLTIYFETDTDIKNLPKLYSSISIENKTYTYNNNWQNHFKPIIINDIVIKPSWDKNKFNNKLEIIIDPGLAFGTGLHETTQGIIEYLSNISNSLKNKDIADIGTGTGVLSIVTSKYGAKTTAIDIDKDSIVEAKKNAKINNCKNIIFTQSGIEDFETKNKYDIVLANILSGILIKNRENLINLLKNKGILVLSGILLKQKKDILNSFKKYFKKHTEIIKNDWISFIFEEKI